MKNMTFLAVMGVSTIILFCPSVSNAQRNKTKSKAAPVNAAKPSTPTPVPAPSQDIAAARTAVLVTSEHSKAACTRIAHQICDQIFGTCAKSDEAAIGGEAGYLVMYQCHAVRMTRGAVTVLVIAGSRTEGTSSAKLTDWIIRSHGLAWSLFEQ